MEGIVPELIAPTIHQKISLGKVHIFDTFAVKYYKIDEIDQCVNFDKFICLSEKTNIHQISDLEESIKHNTFDFYAPDQMKSLANLNIFLTVQPIDIIFFFLNLLIYKYYHVFCVHCRCFGSTTDSTTGWKLPKPENEVSSHKHEV